jgi:hypothetical protein
MEIKDCIHYFGTVGEGENSELIEVIENTSEMNLPITGRLIYNPDGSCTVKKYYVKNPVYHVGGIIFLSTPYGKNRNSVEVRVDIKTEKAFDTEAEIAQELKDEIAQKIYKELFEHLSMLIVGEVNI